MTEKNAVTLQALLRLALPLNTTIAAGDPETAITWAITIRAATDLPEIYGGEMAIVAVDMLQSVRKHTSPAKVVEQLAQANVAAIAIAGSVSQTTIAVAQDLGVALLLLPEDSAFTSIERAVNKAILNQSAQLAERAIEIQRKLTRLAAENRDLNSLLQVMARATAKAMVIHDDAGVMIAQAYPSVGRRGSNGRAMMQNMPYGTFQKWLLEEAPNTQGAIVPSPIGHTTALQVEKRIAGFLSYVTSGDGLDDLDRMVLTSGADVCALELAKSRAIASAVEQARGDWIQMWLSGAPTDGDLLATRAQQSGFNPDGLYVVALYRALTDTGESLPIEALVSLVRDDMLRRQLDGAVGQYIDSIVALYPVESASNTVRVRTMIDELREQLALRTPSGLVAAGISRPYTGLRNLREAYREAKDSVSIAQELGENDNTTFYGDLKLYQLLLALKDRNLEHLQVFFQDTLNPLVEHDDRKQSELVRTLEGFFAANGNLAQAAKDLDVHRNTLVYRLEKISELTDIDLNDPDNRLLLHLALKVQRVLATVPERIPNL